MTVKECIQGRVQICILMYQCAHFISCFGVYTVHRRTSGDNGMRNCLKETPCTLNYTPFPFAWAIGHLLLWWNAPRHISKSSEDVPLHFDHVEFDFLSPRWFTNTCCTSDQINDFTKKRTFCCTLYIGNRRMLFSNNTEARLMIHGFRLPSAVLFPCYFLYRQIGHAHLRNGLQDNKLTFL